MQSEQFTDSCMREVTTKHRKQHGRGVGGEQLGR